MHYIYRIFHFSLNDSLTPEKIKQILKEKNSGQTQNWIWSSHSGTITKVGIWQRVKLVSKGHNICGVKMIRHIVFFFFLKTKSVPNKYNSNHRPICFWEIFDQCFFKKRKCIEFEDAYSNFTSNSILFFFFKSFKIKTNFKYLAWFPWYLNLIQSDFQEWQYAINE